MIGQLNWFWRVAGGGELLAIASIWIVLAIDYGRMRRARARRRPTAVVSSARPRLDPRDPPVADAPGVRELPGHHRRLVAFTAPRDPVLGRDVSAEERRARLRDLQQPRRH